MIGVIANPLAKGIAQDPFLLSRLSHIDKKNTIIIETHHLEEVPSAVAELLANRVDVIAACGGDGTNLAVLSAMVQIYGNRLLPAFATLRGGTVNTIATNLGIKGRPDELLMRLVSNAQQGVQPLEIRTLLQVNEHYGFLFGGAMASRFFKVYYSNPRRGVAWASFLAVRVTLSSLFHTPFSRQIFEPVSARITVDDAVLPHDRWTLLVASTLVNVGLNIRITYRAQEQNTHFHLVASGLPPFQLARQFPQAFLARPLAGAAHFDLLSRGATIEFDGPETYIMDGDLFEAQTIHLRAGPVLRLCVA